MNFYESISKYYDLIFTGNDKKYNFLKNIINKYPEYHKLLDIGCATGGFAELASQDYEVTGIDNDAGILDIARSRNKSDRIKYYLLNMLDLTGKFSEEEFGIITSFGNTLVHLPDENSIRSLFNQVYKILKPNGLFCFQILNYDRIFKNNIRELPLIENTYVKFQRYYDFLENDMINFKTILIDKKKNKTIKNSQILFGIRKDKILRLLRFEKFEDIKYYGSFECEEFHDNSFPLIISCIK